jgi:hypothetical protein
MAGVKNEHTVFLFTDTQVRIGVRNASQFYRKNIVDWFKKTIFTNLVVFVFVFSTK